LPNSPASHGNSAAGTKAAAARAVRSMASKPVRSRAIVLPSGPTGCATSRK
jgi:hypothetical protein